jgi:hypothetical protein
VTTADASAAIMGEDGIGVLRLARLLIGQRLRSLRNGMRARGKGRFPVLATVVGLITAMSYVGLFAQSFRVICENTDVTGQITALAMVALVISFGSFTAKAASSEAVMAGSPENEFLLARPVALPRLVVARCLAEAATDPVGALFLFPVLLAATVTWRLPGFAVGLAVLCSLLVQLGISAMSQATQISVVRFVPRRRRRAAWMALGLLASFALASLWMMGTRVLRAPATVATGLAPLAPLVSRSPGALIVGPLAALARGQGGAALAALGLLAGTALAAVVLAAQVAARAGMRGWEEAGATWADATARPIATSSRVLTAATKDLALIVRDRTRLLTLVSMPIIFVGVQLFGAAGWDWSTATVSRVAHVAFSLTLYMATIGPLAHMQAERRAFWIMRAVPISVGGLLAAKAKAWSVVVGGTALLAYLILSTGIPHVDAAEWLATGFAVVAGAIGVTWLAISLAAGAADLSDEQRPAIGPVTIYRYMLVGGLFNVVLAGDGPTRARGFFLYAFAIAGQWLAGVQQATICLDAEAVRERRLTLADGAAFVVAFALGRIGVAQVAEMFHVDPLAGALIANVSVGALVGIAAAAYLARRRPTAPARLTAVPAVVLAVAAGALGGAAGHAIGLPAVIPGTAAGELVASAGFILLVVLAQEVLFRGIVQRAVEEVVATVPRLRRAAPALAAVASVLVALASEGGQGAGQGALLAFHGAAAAAMAVSGRFSSAVLARVAAAGAALALSHFHP